MKYAGHRQDGHVFVTKATPKVRYISVHLRVCILCAPGLANLWGICDEGQEGVGQAAGEGASGPFGETCFLFIPSDALSLCVQNLFVFSGVDLLGKGKAQYVIILRKDPAAALPRMCKISSGMCVLP